MSCQPRQTSIESWLGYEAIALIRPEPGELTRRFGLRFESGYDDLDETLVAALEAPSGRRFGLLRHIHAPIAGTEILWDLRRDDLPDALGEVLGLLELGPSEVEWVLSGEGSRSR